MKLAFTMVALMLAGAAAPEPVARPGAPGDAAPATMNFDPAVVEGRQAQPQGGVTTVRVLKARSLLIEVRKGFDERILETADEL